MSARSLVLLIAFAACLVASLCDALGGVYTKRRMQRVSSLTLACGSQLAAAIILLPVLPASVVPGPVTPWVAACVVALAVACTALAHLIYFRLIADVGPSRAEPHQNCRKTLAQTRSPAEPRICWRNSR